MISTVISATAIDRFLTSRVAGKPVHPTVACYLKLNPDAFDAASAAEWRDASALFDCLHPHDEQFAPRLAAFIGPFHAGNLVYFHEMANAPLAA